MLERKEWCMAGCVGFDHYARNLHAAKDQPELLNVKMQWHIMCYVGLDPYIRRLPRAQHQSAIGSHKADWEETISSSSSFSLRIRECQGNSEQASCSTTPNVAYTPGHRQTCTLSHGVPSIRRESPPVIIAGIFVLYCDQSHLD